MSEDHPTYRLTGGCLCGAVRYTATLRSAEGGFCHCRLCQRATGGVAAPFVEVASVEWHSAPRWYASSPVARRGFCGDCGSPLAFAWADGSGTDMMIGSFDDPGHFHPGWHSGTESLHEAWLARPDLPRRATQDIASTAAHWHAAGLEVPD